MQSLIDPSKIELGIKYSVKIEARQSTIEIESWVGDAPEFSIFRN